MSSYINTFLKTELTCIPRLLRKYAGSYFNNVLTNGATWLFFAWCLLHFIYNNLSKALFKRMGCKIHINERLRQSLWYLGFSTAIFIYCGVSLVQNEFIDSDYHILFYETSNNSRDLLVGFLFLITFYLHTILWEAFMLENLLLGLNYMLFVFATITAYYMRSIQLAFALSIIASAAHIAVELIRIVQTLSNYNSKIHRAFTKGFFALGLLFLIAVYAVALPASILLPMGLDVLQQRKLPNLIFIVFCIFWLTIEVFSSPIYRLADHWLFHTGPEMKDIRCPSCFMECSLFLPRDDLGFELRLYRQEMKERREKMMSMRKPKNKNMLVQTLKCMVAIRRKINQKRLSESSDSDETESESKDEPEVKEADDSDSEEESEKQEQNETKPDVEDGVVIKDITDEIIGDTEEIVDGKLQIRVRGKNEFKNE